MIDNYFQLTTKLIHDYIGSTHDNNITEDFHGTDALNQYFIYQDDGKTKLLMVINITKITADQQLINLIHQGDVDKPGDDEVDVNMGDHQCEKVETIMINWSKIDYNVDFPIDEINVSNELIEKFNDLIKDNNREHRLKELFKLTIKSKSPRTRASYNEADLLDHGRPKPGIALGINEAGTSSTSKIADMPDFDDEYEIKGKLRGSTGDTTNIRPSIGDDDLYPGGVKNLVDPTDPLRVGSRGTNGMSPSFNHPLFGQPPSGTRGDDNHPFGARYDDPMGPANDDLVGNGLPGYRNNQNGFGFGGNNSNPFGGPPF